jgi:hypothetical protein
MTGHLTEGHQKAQKQDEQFHAKAQRLSPRLCVCLCG